MEKINAYKDKNGNVHLNEKDCLKADAIIDLKKIFDECTAQGKFFIDEFIEIIEKEKDNKKIVKLIQDVL